MFLQYDVDDSTMDNLPFCVCEREMVGGVFIMVLINCVENRKRV